MTTILLHLVDDDGRPVSPELREAIQRAYLYAVHHFPRVDQAIVADMAEVLAISMCRRLDQIKSLNQYALAAMIGKVHQWFRSHPLVVVPASEMALEWAAGGTPDRAFQDIENEILFEQIKAKLRERDRQILVLIEQGMGTPTAISAALGLTQEAAKKALYRAKEKMSVILAGPHDRTSVVSRKRSTNTEAIAPEVKS